MKTNTPNPLVPQGTFADPKAKSNLRMTVFLIIAGHLVLISGLLMAGCKKTSEPPSDQGLITSTFDNSNLPPLSTSLPPAVVSNPVPLEPSNQPTPHVVISNTLPQPPTFMETEREHTVVAKDSFSSLAKKYNLSVKAIEAANPGVDSRRLKIGQKLKIPASAAPTTLAPAAAEGAEKIHVVKSGERLLTIAKIYGISYKAIKAANNLSTERITVGQKLKIPSKAAAPAAPVEPMPAAVPVAPISTAAPVTPANP